MSNNTPNSSADDTTDWDALGRLLTGESSALEAATLQRQLEADAPKRALVSALSDVLEQATVKDQNPSSSPIDVEAALRRVRAKIVEEGGASVRSIETARTKATSIPAVAPVRPYWRVAAVAAAAAIAATVGIQRWGSSPHSSELQVAAVYSTAVGAVDSVNLPDGSHVVLAPGSRLVVPAGFKTGKRDVTLEGAAYFQVVHDSSRPFAVHAGSAVVRDIGTAFSVKTVAGSAVYVAVREGVVALSDTTAKSGQEVELRAGDRGTARAIDGVSAQRGATTANDPSWNSDVLTFRDATWLEVTTDLKRWYGVQLVVDDSALQKLTVTHTTARQESGADVVRVLASMFDAEVQRRGDTTVLAKRGKLRP